jgi:hypothetical protein
VRKGESVAVEFKLTSAALASLDPENRWTLFPGRYELLVGGSTAQGLTGSLVVVDTPRALRKTANTR